MPLLPSNEALPSKRYFTIGEASALCGVKQHVLRYWEQSFPQLRPVKRRGNRRYYQQHDLRTICQIRSLIYDQGFTAAGARQRLAAEAALPPAPQPTATQEAQKAQRQAQPSPEQALAQTIAELEDLLKTLS